MARAAAGVGLSALGADLLRAAGTMPNFLRNSSQRHAPRSSVWQRVSTEVLMEQRSSSSLRIGAKCS